jgi:hypothetical protein
VTRLLRMPDAPRPADAADALALAICHLWRVPAIAARRAGQAPGVTRPAGAGQALSVSQAAGVTGVPTVTRTAATRGDGT